MEKETFAYFSDNALLKLNSVQGKQVQKVICYLWQNKQNPNDVVELIDNIELVFDDHDRINIACNENGDGLTTVDFDLAAVKEELEREFKGKIKLFAIDASDTKMWKDVKNKVLENIQISKEDGKYKADSILLNFGEEKRTISIGPIDGLIIDYYEEV